ncbi:aromatic acid exporter family protein [Paenibacillus larvae]
MTLGARVLKTGIAVTLSLYLSMFINAQLGLLAAVASIFAMQPSIYRSWRYFLDQLQTNTLGALLAITAGSIFPKDPVAVGIVAIVTIMICLKIKMGQNIGLTLVTVVAIMEASGTHWTYAFDRFLLTSLGIACAFLINILFMPPNLKNRFKRQVEQVLNQLSLLLRTVISNEMKKNVFHEMKDSLEESLQSLEDKYKLFEEENKKMKRMKYSQTRLLVVYKQALQTLRKGLDILDSVEEHYFQAERSPETHAYFDDHLEKLTKYHEYVFMKFEQKVKPDHRDMHDSMEHENIEFLRLIIEYGEWREGKHRLHIVASEIYDYGYQIGRLDKLVEQYNKGQGQEEASKEEH